MITCSLVLYHTKEEELRTVINCLLPSCVDKIYVIDNSETDGLKSVVDSFGSEKVEYIQGQGNVGYGTAHNIAMNKAMEGGAKYHLVLNTDIVFEYSILKIIASFMDLHPDVSYVLPNVVNPDGVQQHLCKLYPTPMDVLGRKFLPAKMIAPRNNKFEMISTGYNKIRNIPILSGCFMFMRVDTLKSVGLFDDRFFMYSEDYDLIRRLHKVSKTVFYPEVTIVHKHAAGHRSSKRLLKIGLISTIKYFNKWGWFFDSERRKINRNAFSDENIIA